MEQIIRDIAATILVVGGGLVFTLEFKEYQRCTKSYRWIYAIKALGAISCSFIFVMALLRLFPGGSDTITPVFGRPVFIVMLLSLLLGAIYNKRVTGGC